jgi:GNAT superfamily N-acetyltransferase
MWDESARAAFTELLPHDHEFPRIEAERWCDLIEDPGVSMILVEDDEEIVASTACGESRDDDADPSVGEVRSFFVAAGHWRHGVGRLLMAAALDSLKGRGCTEATVWSFADNERANAFYESQGFVRDDAEKSQDFWAGLREVRYRRSL